MMRTRWMVWSAAVVLSTGCAPENSGKEAILQGIRSVEQSRKSAGLHAATDLFGPLVVRDGEYEAEATVRPWSSWWYPLNSTYLFRGEGHDLAPLQKYDRYMKRIHGIDAHAADFEFKNLFDPNAASWEGLCNAWAAASILEPEPVKPVDIDGTHFSVGDLKALLVKSYEDVQGLRPFGQRNNGDRTAIFDDLYPDQFHRIMQEELFVKGHAFIMDKDPGLPVWNTPVWKADIRIENDASDGFVKHVTAWIFGASPFVQTFDEVGTLSVVFEYTYDLHGVPGDDGTFSVAYGQWTGKSRDYHPDFVTLLPEQATHSSRNTQLSVPGIQEILAGGIR